jgi:3',5'-cyclic AMP phosphodiesterase CpdA
MSGNTIELLHLSDLHFGPHSRFADADPAELGHSFASNLLQERERLKLSRLDLVIVTGDLAEAGKPKEFNTAAAFLGALAGDLGIERREFVFVPGNHDVSWFRCMNIENNLKEGRRTDRGELPRTNRRGQARTLQEVPRGFLWS